MHPVMTEPSEAEVVVTRHVSECLTVPAAVADRLARTMEDEPDRLYVTHSFDRKELIELAVAADEPPAVRTFARAALAAHPYPPGAAAEAGLLAGPPRAADYFRGAEWGALAAWDGDVLFLSVGLQ